MFSTKQLLTKSDSGMVTFAGLETPKQFWGHGLAQASAVDIPKWLSFEVMHSDLSESCSANFKD